MKTRDCCVIVEADDSLVSIAHVSQLEGLSVALQHILDYLLGQDHWKLKALLVGSDTSTTADSGSSRITKMLRETHFTPATESHPSLSSRFRPSSKVPNVVPFKRSARCMTSSMTSPC